jgi:hypothetical protein
MAPLPEACSQHAAVAVGSVMYVLGGLIDGGATASVLKYDSTQGTWSQVAPMSEPGRFAFAACAIESDIYVFGGQNGHDRNVRSSVSKYNTVANEWITLAPMPYASYSHSACVLNGLVYITGAGDSSQEVLRFDRASGAWSSLAPMLNGRFGVPSFVVGGCLYAASGGASVQRYDPASNTWAAVADMLEGHSCYSAVTIGSAGPTEEQDLFDTLIVKAISRCL